MTEQFESILTFLATIAGFGITIWLIKKWLVDLKTSTSNKINEIRTDIRDLNTCYVNLCKELPDKYAARSDVGHLFGRVDVISDRVSKIEGRMDEKQVSVKTVG